MKNTSKLACLLSLGLLSGLFMLASVSDASSKAGVSMGGLSGLDTAHKSRLIKLYLLEDSNPDHKKTAYISATSQTLDIYNGFVVDEVISSTDNVSSPSYVVIGGGKGSNVDGTRSSGIAGGENNTVSADKAAIGGGLGNKVTSTGGVVAGGQGNTSNGGVVAGGQGNTSNGGVVLGGSGNTAGLNGLAMGQGAKGGAGSFVRNDGGNVGEAGANSALIGAQNGVLIGEVLPAPKNGVSLVVNGPIKIWDNTSAQALPGEIRSQGGCLYSFDGISWHALGNVSQGSCNKVNLGGTMKNVADTCIFGRVKLQEGDVVTAYSKSNAQGCEIYKKTVTCTNGKLIGTPGDTTEYFPSCFELSSNPYHL